jgi:hypothetical protein
VRVKSHDKAELPRRSDHAPEPLFEESTKFAQTQ